MHRCRKFSAFALVVLVSLAAAAPALAFTYPAAVRTTFVRTCVKSGGTTKTCTCVIKYIEKRVSLKQFEQQAESSKKGGLSALEKKAVQACI
jgi:hypothetical protein